MGAKQLGLGDYEQSTAKKQTKREKFLSEMDKVVPWQLLIDLIEPSYPKTGSKGGRHQVDPEHGRQWIGR
jgi:IS5 family transposase